MRYCVLIMVICFAWALAGCAGDIINSKVENKIKESLPKLIGPAKSYDVEVRGPHSKMIKGHIKKLVIHGKDVWMLPDLCVDKLEVRMADVKADRKKSALKSVGETSFDAVISEKSLNEYIDSIRTDKPDVKLLKGKMNVHGRPKAWVFSANVDITGSLMPKGSKLYFQIDRLTVAGLKSPDIAIRLLEDWINPVLDLSTTGYSPEFRSVEILPGEVRITGTANLIGNGQDRGLAHSDKK